MLTFWQLIHAIADLLGKRERGRRVWAKLRALGIGHRQLADTQHEALELYAGLKACMEPAEFDLVLRAPRLAAEGASQAIAQGRRSEKERDAQRDALAIFQCLAAGLPKETLQRFRERPDRLLLLVVLHELGRHLECQVKPSSACAPGQTETDGLLWHGVDVLPTLDAIKRGITCELSEDGRSLRIRTRARFATQERGAGSARFAMPTAQIKPRPFLTRDDKKNHRGTEPTEGETGNDK